MAFVSGVSKKQVIEIANSISQGPTGPTGPSGGPTGPTGATGATGPQGTDIHFIGSVATVGALPMVGNSINDARIVDANGNLYVWGANGTWTDAGQIVGPTGPSGGPTGPVGPAGADGADGAQGAGYYYVLPPDADSFDFPSNFSIPPFIGDTYTIPSVSGAYRVGNSVRFYINPDEKPDAWVEGTIVSFDGTTANIEYYAWSDSAPYTLGAAGSLSTILPYMTIVGKPGQTFRFRGEWAYPKTDGLGDYVKDDIVLKDGSSYVLTTNLPSYDQNSNPPHEGYQLLAAAGSGFVYEGEWISQGNYVKNDIVSYRDNLYIVTATYAFNAPTDTNQWSLYLPTVSWKGEWVINQLYIKGDIVSYNGSSYISNDPQNIYNTPDTYTQWDLLAPAGQTGPTGATGPTGPAPSTATFATLTGTQTITNKTIASSISANGMREKVSINTNGFGGTGTYYAYLDNPDFIYPNQVDNGGNGFGLVHFISADALSNQSIDFYARTSTFLNDWLQVNESITVVINIKNGATPRIPSSWKIDGTTVYPKWQGGTAPTAGNANSIDSYVITIIKTANNTYTVFASQTKFA